MCKVVKMPPKKRYIIEVEIAAINRAELRIVDDDNNIDFNELPKKSIADELKSKNYKLYIVDDLR